MQTFFVHMDSALFDIVGADTIAVDKIAFPSVDDVVRESVAMVWHDGTDILYRGKAYPPVGWYRQQGITGFIGFLRALNKKRQRDEQD